MWGNYPVINCPGQFFWVPFSERQLSGGQLSWGAIVRGQLSWGAIVPGAVVLQPLVITNSLNPINHSMLYFKN